MSLHLSIMRKLPWPFSPDVPHGLIAEDVNCTCVGVLCSFSPLLYADESYSRTEQVAF